MTMENKKLNVLDFISKSPNGAEFYTTLFESDKEVNCVIDKIDETAGKISICPTESAFRVDLNSDGSLFSDGECMIYPKKDIRDWTLYGVLWMNGGKHTKKILESQGGKSTQNQCLDQRRHYFIRRITNDICCAEDHYPSSTIDFILSHGIDISGKAYSTHSYSSNVNTAFEAGDKVLVRNSRTEEWQMCIFSHFSIAKSLADERPYSASGSYWLRCIPYDAKLVGKVDTEE